MTKIKLSLPSGSEVEKPVISYFNNGGNYLILDAESVGSMGLPIILVAKVTDNKAEKIIDQNEWQQVKGYLKNIISGGATNYLEAPEAIPADETYYTQLTLPVASFDALKNNYSVVPAAPEASGAEPAPAVQEDGVETPAIEETAEPVAETSEVVGNTDPNAMTPVNMSTEVAPDAPVVEEAPVTETPTEEADAIVNPLISDEPAVAEEPAPEAPVVEETPAEEAPVIEEPVATEEPAVSEAPVAEEAPTEEAPVIEQPVIEEPVVDSAPTESEEIPIEEPAVVTPDAVDTPPVIEEAPAIAEEVVEPQVESAESSDNSSELKERFMKACEEIFDVLSSIK